MALDDPVEKIAPLAKLPHSPILSTQASTANDLSGHIDSFQTFLPINEIACEIFLLLDSAQDGSLFVTQPYQAQGFQLGCLVGFFRL